jgi:glutathione S-transferase
MITIYGRRDSGNCYKPRLLMALLGRPFVHVEVDSTAGETRSPEFLALNPAGQVPLLRLEDGRLLAESNAILLHLGESTRFVPGDPYERGLMYQWLFFEQYSHEPQIAVRRSLMIYPSRRAQATPERLAATLDGGNRALGVMERRLSATPYLAGDAPSLADIALYAYTHVAGEGGFDLSALPATEAWLARMAAEPAHVPIDWLPDTSEKRE